ncbi:Methanol dehydrogenase subunit 2 [Granulibacter bethesdensis]|uniref:Methanol dehydrogenase [cytochrome c] subunit 2 n=1 Tax=Granulibacter bethesdensis TaxID=364410 RepID=A0AAC9K7Z0_9PROT|nr:methanol dehydrogenase [cytochrome c] subunit [Granulibacter bethesdensis]APH53576.1 Methanol dehydrogenase subunit 2 [Granulibacter bethesdensis]APH61154.1 Methanol dehydrogenase subunit 2 [Granulibacter bethesdensis]
MFKRIIQGTLAAALIAGAAGASVAHAAYDGTHCKAPGVCWEPEPGYPAVLKGSKYDPHHDPKELAKQQAALDAQEARNKLRVENFVKTGKFEFDVNKLQGQGN